MRRRRVLVQLTGLFLALTSLTACTGDDASTPSESADTSSPDGAAQSLADGLVSGDFGDVGFTSTDSSQEPEPAGDDAQAARITLRSPEQLKTRAEAAAAAEGVSLNTWLVRATSRALDRGRGHSGGPGGRRITGYATS